MVMMDLKSSLSNFVLKTSRAPRIVHPFLWDSTHCEALGVSDNSVSFETIDLLSERGRQLTEHSGGRKLLRDEDGSQRWFSAFNSEVAHIHSELSSGNGTIAAGFLLHYLRSWARGDGYRSPFVPGMKDSRGRLWNLDSRESVYNHTPLQRFQCYGWQTYLQVDDVTVLRHDSQTSSDESQIPPILATATTCNMHWYWESYAFRKDKQRDSIFRRLRRDTEKQREDRKHKLPSKLEDLDPIIPAILIGMAQEQRSCVPRQSIYSSHFAYPFVANQTSNASLSIVFISARFSDSYLEALEFDPNATTASVHQHGYPSPSPSSPATPSFSKDFVDFKVRVFKDVVSRSLSLDQSNRSCKAMLQCIGSEITMSVDDLAKAHSRSRTDSVDNARTLVPILKMNEGDSDSSASKKRRAIERLDSIGCHEVGVQEKMSLKRMCT